MESQSAIIIEDLIVPANGLRCVGGAGSVSRLEEVRMMIEHRIQNPEFRSSLFRKSNILSPDSCILNFRGGCP